jgi:UPF0716 protein FxsA
LHRDRSAPILSGMNPLFIFILLILGLPTLELYLLIEIGSEIGAFPAIFLVLFTAVLGGYLMRRQGISTLMRVRQSMDRGEVPALEMLEGAVLLLGGLLLLIPGFFTDAVGFLCLVPGLRRLLLLNFLRRAQLHGEVVQSSDRPASGPRVIEGEFHREND